MATRSVAGLAVLFVVVLLVAAPGVASASSDDLSAEEVCALIPAYEGGFGPGEYDPAAFDQCTYIVFLTETQSLRLILRQWDSAAMAAGQFDSMSSDLARRTGSPGELRDIGDAARHWVDGSTHETIVLVGRFTVWATGLGGFDAEAVAREVAAAVAALVPATTTTAAAATTTTAVTTTSTVSGSTSTTEPASCAPQGTITDQAGAPMPGLRVRLLLAGQVADQRVTDEDGWYQFADLGFLAEAFEFDPAEGGYVVAVALQDAVEGAARFEIRYGPQGVLPEVRRGPLTVEADPACRVDFAFADVGDQYSVVAGPGSPEEWRSLALAYQSIRKAYLFAAYSFGTPLTMTPLPVYLFCQGNPPGVHGQPCQQSPAYFRGGFSNELEREGPPFIAFGVPMSSRWSSGERPVNGEYHEFGHALMADSFGGFMPNVPDSVNHAGYRNPTSTDSWTEGFAEWFATQVARHVDGAPRWWLVPIKGQVISLEDDRWVNGNQGKDEELAIAGILVDLVDGDADYTAPTPRQLTILGIADLPDPDHPEGGGVAVEIRNDTGVAQSSIGVSGDFGGVAGLFATRVDGFVDPGVLQPGETGQAVIPYEHGFGWADLDSVKVVGLGIGDDDGVTRSADEVWQAILAYRSTSEHSKGYVMNTSELYEALRDAFPADLAAIDAIFVAHGVYADMAPRNAAHDPGESIGITSLDDGRLRTDYEAPEVFEAAIETAGTAARVQVQVLYPEPRDALSYAYATAPDPNTGTISVAVPPAHTGAVVRMVVRADGRLPVLLPDLYAEDFWAQADANGYQPFLDYQVTLVTGNVMANAVAVRADGSPRSEGGLPVAPAAALAAALVAAGAGAWWWRRRRLSAAAGAALPVHMALPAADGLWRLGTHVTPASGLPGRPEPHPAVAAVTAFAGGAAVQVVERRADWALVRTADGSEAWVDGRRLVSVTEVPPPPPPPDEDAPLAPEAAASASAVPARSGVILLTAAAALPVSAFLPWRAGGWPSPFRVSATFLWDVEAELGGFSIGLVALLLGAAALATLFLPRLRRHRRLVGGVACWVAALWLIETFRYVWGYAYLGWGFVGEVFTVGPWLALAAGLVLVLKRR